MARLFTAAAVTPIAVNGVGVTGGQAPQWDMIAATYEPDATESRAPYIAAWARATSSQAGVWTFPAAFGFRLLLEYTDGTPLAMIERAKSAADNPWSGIAITAAGSYWFKCILQAGEVDFQRQAAPPSAATEPLASADAVERFTISSSKIADRLRFFQDRAA